MEEFFKGFSYIELVTSGVIHYFERRITLPHEFVLEKGLKDLSISPWIFFFNSLVFLLVFLYFIVGFQLSFQESVAGSI